MPSGKEKAKTVRSLRGNRTHLRSRGSLRRATAPSQISLKSQAINLSTHVKRQDGGDTDTVTFSTNSRSMRVTLTVGVNARASLNRVFLAETAQRRVRVF